MPEDKRIWKTPGFWTGVITGLVGALVLGVVLCIAVWSLGGNGWMYDDGSGEARRDGMMGEGMMGDGMMMDGEMPGWMMSREGSMGRRGMMADMRTIHMLLAQHDEIQRTVEDIPNGVRTVTTSQNPDVADAIRRHVRQMKARMEDGRPIRRRDPLFRELFRNHEAIQMDIEDVPGGVRVVETSERPEVVLLIRQHARRAVSEFVEQGMPRARESTPLPDGYER